MRRNVWRGLLLATMALWCVALSAAPSPEYSLEVKGRVEIGPDGKVLDYRIDKGTPKAVQPLVEKAVRSWRFEPVVENGRPVIAMTDMTIALRAVLDGDDYLLRVENVWFGGSLATTLTPPRYPGALSQRGIAGTVMLVLRLHETGKVDRVHVERVDLGQSGSKFQIKAWSEQFAKAAVDAAQEWAWEPFEFVDGKPVPTNVRVPVDFTFRGSPWIAHHQGVTTPAPWIKTRDTQLASRGPAPSGQATSVNSRFQLIDQVEGKML